MNALTPVASVSAIARSGMQAAQTRLATSAHNIANMNTEGFHREEVVQQADPAGGVDTAVQRSPVPGADTIADVVDQLAAKQEFMANLAVFKSGNRMLGSLLDTQA